MKKIQLKILLILFIALLSAVSGIMIFIIAIDKIDNEMLEGGVTSSASIYVMTTSATSVVSSYTEEYDPEYGWSGSMISTKGFGNCEIKYGYYQNSSGRVEETKTTTQTGYLTSVQVYVQSGYTFILQPNSSTTPESKLGGKLAGVYYYNYTSWEDDSSREELTRLSTNLVFTPRSGNNKYYLLYYNCKMSSTLTINPNGGSYGGTTSNTTITQNESTTYTLSTPTRTGYKFNGWSLSGGGSLSGSKFTFGSSNATLTASWVDSEPPVIHRVTWQQNGEVGYFAYAYATDNVGITRVRFPTWTVENGQDDIIWHEGSSGNWTVGGQTYNWRYEVKIADHNNERGAYVTHVYAYDEAVNNTSVAIPDIVFSYTLSVNPNGGTWNGSASNQTFTQKIGTTKALSVPTREGYKFKGWQAVNATGATNVLGQIVGQNDSFFDTTINLSEYAGGEHSRVSANLAGSPYNRYVLKIISKGADSSRAGGFTFGNRGYDNAEYYCVIQAKFPVGYAIEWDSNWSANTVRWIGNGGNQGTGSWETYICYIKLAVDGNNWGGGDTNYFSVYNGPSGSEENPVTWEVASAQSYDATGMGLNPDTVVANMTKSTTYTFGTDNQTLVAMWQVPTWLDLADTSWSGEGTEASPYIIDSAEKLAGLAAKCVNNDLLEGKYFKQTADISLGGYDWTPIGVGYNDRQFKGNYDGNSFKITGMYINKDADCLGLFGATHGAIIKNVTVNNSTIIGGEDKNSCGAIVGVVDSGSIIDNCQSNADIYGFNRVGGLVGGLFDGTIKNSTFSGYVEGNEKIGGIVGYSGGKLIENCVNNGNINCLKMGFGGIVGEIYGATIRKCTVNGTMKGPRAGAGIAGSTSDSTFENCIVNGQIIFIESTSVEVDLGSWFGALLGYIAGEITLTNCVFVGESNYVASAEKGDLGYFHSFGNSNTANITSCYSKINGKGYYSDGDFSGFGIVAGMNGGMPMQRELFFMAEIAPTFDVSWFAENGFEKI